MNPNCGWCKKSDPVVEELIKDGYNITTLNITNPEDAKIANEAKAKHNAQCGTPLFLDTETGNMACGFREKDVLEKWVRGEEIPKPEPRKEHKKPEKWKLEYIWIDGNDTKSLRSKVRYAQIIQQPNLLKSIPDWGFDGSSTNQAETNSSDCVLKPVKIFPNPIESRHIPTYYVLCEVYNSDGTPHETNTRAKLREAIINSDIEDVGLLVGIEQEYVITDPRTNKPFGWEKYENDTPPPQGQYYCGVGADTNISRNLADAHANICIQSGIFIDGYHPEVMLSQWEYQTGVGMPLDISDQLWMSRFILQRIGERMDVSISYDPKHVDGDWNGSGTHINFSNGDMRNDIDLSYITLLCANLQESHNEAIDAYGNNNKKRLTGKHETSSIDKFSWGVSDRSASIRIPLTTSNNGRGHLEDRRPAANMDPYEALSYLVSAVSNINKEMKELMGTT